MPIISYRYTVTKGCPAIGIAKGDGGWFTMERLFYGVKVVLEPDNGAAKCLWTSGNRRTIPLVSKGTTLNLNTGDPTQRVKIEVG